MTFTEMISKKNSEKSSDDNENDEENEKNRFKGTADDGDKSKNNSSEEKDLSDKVINGGRGYQL